MGKGKPRHNPDKPQNKFNKYCIWCHYDPEGNARYCERPICGDGIMDINKCKGNTHNCKKVTYKVEAIRKKSKTELSYEY
ncbi:MAG: hypothetical protein ACOCQD_04850 [archaeon]